MTWGRTNGGAAPAEPSPVERRAAELDALERWAENMAGVFAAREGFGEGAAYLDGVQSGFADSAAGIVWLRENPEQGGSEVDETLARWATDRCVEALREADQARDALEVAHARGRAVAFDRARTRFRQSPSPAGVRPLDGERG
ncbi:MAG: hypothetical protein AB8I08_32940 [Sandaracinaceae bacterium]